MRIIAGEFKGRRLLGPADAQTTRPTPDRVKEALFSRLESMGFFTEAGAGAVCDVFCGTGSLGLEAISRGARRCLFVEQDREAVRRLKENIATLDCDERAMVQAGSAFSPIWQTVAAGDRPAMIFLDPPYRLAQDTPDKLIDLLTACGKVLHAEGIVVLRLPDKLDPPITPGWRPPASHRYGSMALHFYEPAAQQQPADVADPDA